ncbi:hypothetical protein IRY61_05395 [Candidatus Saccharibacteria bacterium]|nr:hypothetical protein [Candidatus Saccharibacteria bacterium]
MKITKPLNGLTNKIVSKRELARYFDTDTIDELLLALREGASRGYFDFQVLFSKEYLVWSAARQELLRRADTFDGDDKGYTATLRIERETYGLDGLFLRSGGDRQLNDAEIVAVTRKLPSDLVERYLRFKLSNIDKKKVYELVANQQKVRGADDEFYDRVEYNGLVADGTEITYNGEPITMSFQHRQVVRLLLKKRGELCYKDEFTDNVDIFARANYPNPNKTLAKLVAAVHDELRAVVRKDCIVNVPKEGWKLVIEP